MEDIEFKSTPALRMAVNALISDKHQFECWYKAEKDIWVMRTSSPEAFRVARMEWFKYDPKILEEE